jgi:hypothetical protein
MASGSAGLQALAGLAAIVCEIRRNPAGDTDLNPATVPI